LQAKVVTTQKKLDLVQKTIDIAPLRGKNLNPQPPHLKEKVGPPVRQTPSKMTEEEEESKSREGFDYGQMKGNDGWLTMPVKTQEKAVPSKKEEHLQKEEIGNTAPAKKLAKEKIQPTSFKEAVQSGKQSSQMTQAQYVEKTRKDMIELVEAKKENFQQRDINRIAQLYLRGYFKELARAAIQDLPTPIVELVLVKAAELVKSKFQNKLLQKRWLFNIQKDKIAFQPAVMEVDRTSS
jgi:hypothetical protein